MAGRDDDDSAATKVEQVPSFAADVTIQVESSEAGDDDVFSDLGEATSAPVPARTDVGEVPTELRAMLRSDEFAEPADTVGDAGAFDDGPGDVTRADPIDVSLGSLDEPNSDGDVFAESDEDD